MVQLTHQLGKVESKAEVKAEVKAKVEVEVGKTPHRGEMIIALIKR